MRSEGRANKAPHLPWIPPFGGILTYDSVFKDRGGRKPVLTVHYRLSSFTARPGASPLPGPSDLLRFGFRRGGKRILVIRFGPSTSFLKSCFFFLRVPVACALGSFRGGAFYIRQPRSGNFFFRFPSASPFGGFVLVSGVVESALFRPISSTGFSVLFAFSAKRSGFEPLRVRTRPLKGGGTYSPRSSAQDHFRPAALFAKSSENPGRVVDRAEMDAGGGAPSSLVRARAGSSVDQSDGRRATGARRTTRHRGARARPSSPCRSASGRDSRALLF